MKIENQWNLKLINLTTDISPTHCFKHNADFHGECLFCKQDNRLMDTMATNFGLKVRGKVDERILDWHNTDPEGFRKYLGYTEQEYDSTIGQYVREMKAKQEAKEWLDSLTKYDSELERAKNKVRSKK